MPYMIAIKTKVTTEFSTTTAHKIFRTGYGQNMGNFFRVYFGKSGNDKTSNTATVMRLKTICEFSYFDIEMYVNLLSSIALVCTQNFYKL